MKDLINDIETYPNVFLISYLQVGTGKIKVFEMSPWRNDWDEFKLFAKNSSQGFVRWVGFNNYYFDYPVIHAMLQLFNGKKPDGLTVARAAYKKAQELIQADKDEKMAHIIWDNNQIVPQVDLFRIHHFDNAAKSTSLKVLEFNMRSETVEDLPFDYRRELTEEECKRLIAYNKHDLRETEKFYEKSLPMIRFREELSAKYERNFMNHNDTKIGKDYFIMELEKAGVKCYNYDDGTRKPNQTKRPVIKIRDVIFPYIQFKRPEFNAVLKWLKRQEITATKGVFAEIRDFEEIIDYINHDAVTVRYRSKNGKPMSRKLTNYKIPDHITSAKDKIAYVRQENSNVFDVYLTHLHVVVNGFQFDFGTGGIHGSVSSTIMQEDATFKLIDYDVTSLYPSIAIVNEVFPKHLTKKFCAVYAQLKSDRVSYKKGTPENAMLKLALNGVYGDSNNQFSPFYDPQYTMTITINGQLMLCMLAEQFMEVEGLKIIQINTDGITVKTKRDQTDNVEGECKKWMQTTRLDLERADYKRMFIRDVNNYIGEYTPESADAQKKAVKCKGAYEWEGLYRPNHPKPADITWHKNHSAVIVQQAVQAHLIDGADIHEFIRAHQDPFDFMLRVKAPKTSRLMCGDKQIQNTTRYYISTTGEQMVKVMAPLAKNPEAERPIKIHDGYRSTPMNTMGEVKDIDYSWYVREAQELITPLYQGMLADLAS